MKHLRTMQYVLLLALVGAQLSHAGSLTIDGLKALPRGGNNSCWVDTGARLKNICPSAAMLSFIPEIIDPQNLTISAFVYTDAKAQTFTCQSVSLSVVAPSSYWSLGPSASNGLNSGGVSYVFLGPWKPTRQTFQIDCTIPAGVTVFGAQLLFY